MIFGKKGITKRHRTGRPNQTAARDPCRGIGTLARLRQGMTAMLNCVLL
jgi:hypothetical protein